ncbi:type II toxin-antitoxin system HicA family toxin [Brachyspira aalborgi]
MKAKEIIKILKKNGYYFFNQKGSHMQFKQRLIKIK